MSPNQIHTTLLEAVQETAALIAAGYSISELGEELENLSNYFQGLAITHLLRGANLDQFKVYLTRSGHARRYFLSRSARVGRTGDHRLSLGRTEAFFDVAAAGQMALAQGIASLSGNMWNPEWEYEDDFCYFQFLHRIAGGLNTVDESELQAILAKFEKALEGGKSLRLNTCRAILAHDSKAFHTALVALMEHRREELLKLRELMQNVDPPSCVCWARSFVSIEGLALQRLAEVAGLPAPNFDPEPPLCPAFARIPAADTLYEDFFEEVERELAKER